MEQIENAKDTKIKPIKQIYQCEICHVQFRYKNQLDKHQNTYKHLRHGEKKIYRCSKCDYKDKIKL